MIRSLAGARQSCLGETLIHALLPIESAKLAAKVRFGKAFLSQETSDMERAVTTSTVIIWIHWQFFGDDELRRVCRGFFYAMISARGQRDFVFTI